jgi:hypothetical protein
MPIPSDSRPGTQVRVNCGTFYGLMATVVAVDGLTMPAGHIAVMMMIFCRPCVMSFTPESLDAA